MKTLYPHIYSHESREGSAIFSVLQPGLMTTVQDRGRFGYQWMGMPVSGALDQWAHRAGNILLGQDENEPSLEMTYMGLNLQVLSDNQIVVTGADVTPKINGSPFPLWTVTTVHKGDVLSMGKARSGCRAYLCVKGGIDVPLIMGSRSTFLRLKIGGVQGRALLAGDRLSSRIVQDRIILPEGKSCPNGYIPTYASPTMVRVILGPQKDYFDKKEGLKIFLESSYQLTADSNREGFRLEGPLVVIKENKKKSIPSEACPPGAIQIRPNGKPIILLNDLGGGGYAKIGHIISTDLPQVAQLKPGDTIKFTLIALPEAHRLYLGNEHKFTELKQWVKGLG
jgi:biotin-dependent carboxylase-like uncharacterized protein